MSDPIGFPISAEPTRQADQVRSKLFDVSSQDTLPSKVAKLPELFRRTAK
jgi:hypothetical protein